MQINCPHCNAQYNLNEAKIPPEGASIPCSKCSNQFVVYPPNQAAGAVPLPGAAPAAGAVPLPGAGAAPAPFGDPGAVPLPGAAPAAAPFPGAVPLPGQGGAPGAVPLPGQAAGGAVPLPGQAGGGAVPLPGQAGAGAVPLPGQAGAVPLPGQGGAPAPKSAGMADMFGDNQGAQQQQGSPFYGTNSVVVGDGGPTSQEGLLDFIGNSGGAGAQYKIRKRSGQVIGPFDEAVVIQMFEGGQLTGSEEASADGTTWKPMAQMPAFGPVIQRAMAAALQGIDPAGLDLPALRGSDADLPMPAGADLPAPAGAELPTPAGVGLPTPAGVGLPTPAGRVDLPAPHAHLPTPTAPLGAQTGQPGVAALPPLDKAKPRKQSAGGGKGRVVALALVAVLLLVVGGGVSLEFLTEHGWFGHKWIMAKISGEGQKPIDKTLPPPKLPDVDVPPLELLAKDTYLAYRQGAEMQGIRVKKGKEITPMPPAAREAAAEQARMLGYLLVVEKLSEFKKPLAEAVVIATTGSPARIIGESALSIYNKKPDDVLVKLEPLVVDKGQLKGGPLAEMRVWYGLALRAKGNDKGALDMFDRALQAETNDVAALYQQARVLFDLGETEAAAEYAQKVIDENPDHPRAKLLRARVLTLDPKGRAEGVALLTELSTSKDSAGAPGQRAEANMGLAELALADKRWADALKFMNEAVAVQPANIERRKRVAELALKMRDFKEAEANFREILKAEPGSVDGTVGVARSLVGGGKKLEAYDLMVAATKKKPDNAKLTYWTGWAAERYTKVDESKKLYEKARTLDPTYGRPLGALITRAVAAGDLKGARELESKAGDQLKGDARVVVDVARARLAWAKRQQADAEKLLRRAVKVDPFHSEARVALAEILVETERTEEARKTVDAALALDPRNPHVMAADGLVRAYEGQPNWEAPFVAAVEIAADDAELYLLAASAAYQQKNIPRAKFFIDQAQPLAPKNPAVLRMKGMIMRETTPKLALEVFRDASEISPDDPRIRYEQGVTNLNLGRLVEATQLFKKAIQIDPGYADAHFKLGESLAQKGQRTLAQASFRESARLDPNRDDAYIAIARVLIANGDPRGAIQALDEAQKAQPKAATPVCQKGLLLVQQLGTDRKYFRRGLKSLEACVKRDPKHPSAMRVLGDAYVDANKKRRAIAMYKRHVTANPKAPDLASTCERLEQLGSRCR